MAFFQSPSIISKDYPAYWQKLFQSPATLGVDGIINLHHDVFALLIVIAIFTFWFSFHILFKLTDSRFLMTQLFLVDLSGFLTLCFIYTMLFFLFWCFLYFDMTGLLQVTQDFRFFVFLVS